MTDDITTPPHAAGADNSVPLERELRPEEVAAMAATGKPLSAGVTQAEVAAARLLANRGVDHNG
jgi:hypothetical protein